MKITILGSGTSQGVPIITCDCEVCRSNDPKDKRLRTSVLIETDETTICIDAGPDFRRNQRSCPSHRRVLYAVRFFLSRRTVHATGKLHRQR